MEIDAPSAPTSSPSKAGAGAAADAASSGGDKQIKIHPLAIIGISDHHTRVISGGSALPPSAPVVGLLFGHQDGATISIVDAEEMEYPERGSTAAAAVAGEDSSHRQNILRKIDLHQKVFPRHEVVGWYRVHTDDDDNNNNSAIDIVPTDDDLRMNQEEMAQYCGEGVESPLFVLMNAASPQYTGVVPSDENNKKPSSSASTSLDDTLPLTVYETLVSDGGGGVGVGGSAFVNATFELETHEPERIAVEKVFQTQPSNAAGSAAQQKEKEASVSKHDKKGGVGGSSSSSSKRDDKKEFKPSFVRGPSELEMQLDTLQSSIRSMNVRMSILLEFLQKVERGEIPPDNALLRSIDGLLQQLPLVLTALEEGSGPKKKSPLVELENDYSDTMLLSYLAAVAKTAKSVHVYSEKFRGAFESGKSDLRRPMY
jgi:COP9 signalosome complex subunit 6